MHQIFYQCHFLEHYHSYFFSQNFLSLTWKIMKKTLAKFMTQQVAEFFPVERKKLIWVFISACLFVIYLSGVSSFNNSFINKERIILTAQHMVHSRLDHVVFMDVKMSTRHFYQVLLCVLSLIISQTFHTYVSPFHQWLVWEAHLGLQYHSMHHTPPL